MISVMEMEYEGVISKLKKKFVEGLIELFSYWICYYKACDPDNNPPFSNDEGAEILLQLYFKEAPPEIYEYLHSDKATFIKNLIAPRAERITYIQNEDLCEDTISTAESFKKKAAESTFPHILEVSFILLKKLHLDPH